MCTINNPIAKLPANLYRTFTLEMLASELRDLAQAAAEGNHDAATWAQLEEDFAAILDAKLP